jgi:hypothetical protein
MQMVQNKSGWVGTLLLLSGFSIFAQLLVYITYYLSSGFLFLCDGFGRY